MKAIVPDTREKNPVSVSLVKKLFNDVGIYPKIGVPVIGFFPDIQEAPNNQQILFSRLSRGGCDLRVLEQKEDALRNRHENGPNGQ